MSSATPPNHISLEEFDHFQLLRIKPEVDGILKFTKKKLIFQ